jgi:hypothetical protein
MVKAARLVDRHPDLGDALADGVMTTPQVEAITRVTSKGREPSLAEHIDNLVDQARGLPVWDFTIVMRRWAALADDQLVSDTHEQKWQRRHLYASVTPDGCVAGTFLLDPAGVQTLLHHLDHLEPPDPHDTPDGDRTLAQRRADALVALADTAGTRRGTSPPNLNVVVDQTALTGDTPDNVSARCDLDGIGPITRTALEQLACCATVTRLVTAGPTVILDMGRRARVVTKAQQRALAIPDRHCQFPSCRRPAGWCDAHHIISWLDLGDTNVDNLILLCLRHHTLVHHSKWTITRRTDVTLHFTHPARGPRSHPRCGGWSIDRGPCRHLREAGRPQRAEVVTLAAIARIAAEALSGGEIRGLVWALPSKPPWPD